MNLALETNTALLLERVVNIVRIIQKGTLIKCSQRLRSIHHREISFQQKNVQEVFRQTLSLNNTSHYHTYTKKK